MVRKTAAQPQSVVQPESEGVPEVAPVVEEAPVQGGTWEGDYLHREDGTWAHKLCTEACRQDITTKRAASTHARWAHGVMGATKQGTYERPGVRSAERRRADAAVDSLTDVGGVTADIWKMMQVVEGMTAELRRLWKVEEEAAKTARELAEERKAVGQLRRVMDAMDEDIVNLKVNARGRKGGLVYSTGPAFTNRLGLTTDELARLQSAAPGGGR